MSTKEMVYAELCELGKLEGADFIRFPRCFSKLEQVNVESLKCMSISQIADLIINIS